MLVSHKLIPRFTNLPHIARREMKALQDDLKYVQSDYPPRQVPLTLGYGKENRANAYRHSNWKFLDNQEIVSAKICQQE